MPGGTGPDGRSLFSTVGKNADGVEAGGIEAGGIERIARYATREAPAISRIAIQPRAPMKGLEDGRTFSGRLRRLLMRETGVLLRAYKLWAGRPRHPRRPAPFGDSSERRNATAQADPTPHDVQGQDRSGSRKQREHESRGR